MSVTGHENHPCQHHGKVHDKDPNWSDLAGGDNYDKDTAVNRYNGPNIVVKLFLTLNIPKESRIIDIGAGTGLVGQQMLANGFENVDALDGTLKMLEIAKQKNCYKNTITSYVVSDIRLPIEDNIYDAAIMSGVFCPVKNHIEVEALDQIIRVIKPGGIICWSMGLHENPEHGDKQLWHHHFSNHLQTLCSQNKWSFIEPYPIRVKNFYLGSDGLFYAMKVA